MATWLLETLLWAFITTLVCVAIWGFNFTNIAIAVVVSILVSLLAGNRWRGQ